jgi:phosphate transport system substrate-binding protein
VKAHRLITAIALCGALAGGLAACGDDDEGGAASSGGGGEAAQEELTGKVTIDGSSTVQPFAEAASEFFSEEQPGVQVTVGGAGTGAGFERFCAGEIEISDASRPIEDDEKEACEKGGVSFSEVQVANDGIAIIANEDFPVQCVKTADLKKLLGPDSKINNYSELGGDWPDQAVSFFTPGEESGTFDFFTEFVLETDGEERSDKVQKSANDNQIMTGVSGTKGALAYVGFSYAEEAEGIKILEVDSGDGCVAPSAQTIQDGSYKPLSRPIFMYPSQEAIAKPEVKGFMDFTLENAEKIAEAAKIVPMTAEQAEKAKADLTQAES